MGRDYSSVDVDISARLHDRYDLPGLIRAPPDKYAAVSIHGGRYQEWERPSVFLHELVEDDVVAAVTAEFGSCGKVTARPLAPDPATGKRGQATGRKGLRYAALREWVGATARATS